MIICLVPYLLELSFHELLPIYGGMETCEWYYLVNMLMNQQS